MIDDLAVSVRTRSRVEPASDEQLQSSLTAMLRMMAQLVEGDPVAKFVIDADHRITHWNKACEQVTGLRAADMIGTGKQWRAFYAEERPILADLVVSAAGEEVVDSFYHGKYKRSSLIPGAYEVEDFFAQFGDGGRWLFFTAAPLRGGDGEIIGAIETLQDITERRKAEEALRKAHADLEYLVEQRTAQLAEANRRLEADINGRAKAEAELRQSETRFRSLTDLSADWYWEQDEEFRGKHLSYGPDRLTASSIGNFYGGCRWDNPNATPLNGDWEEHKAVLQLHLPFRNFEYKLILDDSRVTYRSVSGEPEFDADGTFKGYRGIGRDITAQKLAEAELRESEARFRSLTALSSDWYWETDADHRFTLLAGADPEKIGADLEAVRGKRRWELENLLASESAWAEHRALHEARLPFRDFIMQRRFPDGTLATFCMSGQPMFDVDGTFRGYRGIGRDLTAQKAAEAELRRRNSELTELNAELSKTQEQLVQSEKLASIGQLAAGVAHEINNPIGYIFSNFSTLENYLGDLFKMLSVYEEAEQALPSPVAAGLQKLRENLELDFLREDIPTLMRESREGMIRVRKIVQDLKDFSRVDDRKEWQWANLHHGIDSTLNIVNNEVKYKADVVKEYGEIPEIQCLPSQINQVVMNLVINAAHAIGAKRGLITIRTGSGGDNVWIDIADNGSGIPKEIQSRIFDPFFTTKPVGKGTGLGLSLAYGIVRKHRGRIEVQSDVGHGTTFHITLPIKQGVAAADHEATGQAACSQAAAKN